ncbi:hypothetical protein Tco_0105701 [Tanacetum coccineum]
MRIFSYPAGSNQQHRGSAATGATKTIIERYQDSTQTRAAVKTTDAVENLSVLAKGSCSTKQPITTLKRSQGKMPAQISILVIYSKVADFRRDFESAVIKSNETVQTYIARVSALLAKILRSLSCKFDHVVAAIQESNDISYNVDETLKSQVRLGDDKEVQVEGNGTVVVTLQGRERFIPDVHYGPGLAHNLLSVGQLMDRGFDVFFNRKNKTCTVIKDGEVMGWQMQGSSEVIYLTHTRPELAYAVGLVSRFMHCPSKQHYGATKRILRYIAGTTTYGIWYVRKEKFELVGYCDSDWAGAKDDMKSTSGNCFMFGSGVVTRASKKQAIVALSSTEAGVSLQQQQPAKLCG